MSIIEEHLKSASVFAKNRYKVDPHRDTSYLPLQNLLQVGLYNSMLRLYQDMDLNTQAQDGNHPSKWVEPTQFCFRQC